MGDSDLEELRRQRLAQLQAQYRGEAQGQTAAQQQEKARAQEDAKNSILSQILDQSARARLNTLMVGKPEKGKLVEDMLINMARAGQINTKIGEGDLIKLLESVAAKIKPVTPVVKYDRRRAAIDSDDDL